MSLIGTIFKNRSLWYKLTLISVLPAVTASSVIALIVMGSVEKAMVAETVARADALVDLTRRSLAHPYVIYNKNLLDSMVDGLGRLPNVSYALVIDSADQRVLAHSEHHLDGRLASELPEGSGRPSSETDPAVKSKKAGRGFYSMSVPIVVENKQFADLCVGFSLEAVHLQMMSVKQGILLVALLAILVGAVLSLFTSRIISAPIHGLAIQARKAGAGDFDQGLIYESTDAIGQLVDAFNRMLADIKGNQAQLKAVNTVADAVYRFLDIRAVARSAVEAMMSFGQYPGVAIFALNETQGRLELIDARGFGSRTLEKAALLPVKGSLTGLAVQQRQVLVSGDLATDPRLAAEVREALTQERLSSVVSVPLLARGKVLGAMNLIYKTTHAITDSEKETLISIGKTIGLAMANAGQMDRIQNEIQERAETEKALRESEDKYRNLVERANDGIVIIQDGLIRYANPSAIALSGQTPADFIEQPFTEYLHPHEKDKITQLYNRRIMGQSPVSIYETVFVRKDGRLIYAEVNAGTTTFQERPADLVFIRDITERKQAQEALKQAYDQLEIKVAERTAELAVAKERAEESDRLKSAFLAAMSHELRTPLNSIIGFTGIILQKLVGPLNDEQFKQLTMVQGSAYHLLSLINDVLDLSKIEAGQLTVAAEAFDLQDVIRRAVATVSPLAEQKQLQITVQISQTVGIVTSDRRRVEQILLNLLNNAIKFTSAGKVRLSCEADTQWVTTRIQDSGIGIAPKDMDKLFKAFHQIETGLARRFEGTGLGLSICKKLVELLGGRIHAHSDGLGQGATFTFALPAGGYGDEAQSSGNRGQ
jgi:PAS domain S-box-containing protein